MARTLNVIVGLGLTGLSCARYLQQQDIPFAVTDSRITPPNLAEFKALFPAAEISLGKIDEALLNKAERLIVSPGVSIHEPTIANQISKGVPVIGDIELFAGEARAPVIAITGTNAKSTVTTLVGEMAKEGGKSVQVGGNLGVPALDLLATPRPELFVVELSSFQLETTHSLAPVVATVLNVTPDHMDRYESLEHYSKTKQRVYAGCQIAVCNANDALTECHNKDVQRKFHFTLDVPSENEFGILRKKNDAYLAFEDKILMPVKELPILGRHYQANALAALSIGYGFGLSFGPMLKTLIDFKGLPHRCQLVRERNGVSWYNDSKGTNVGATLAAIEGLGSEMDGRIILIAGGVGKNADFSPLVPAIQKYAREVILIGEAASVLADLIGDRVTASMAKSMADAVEIADRLACKGDSVLLSPACASFDMFNNFEHRGDVFSEIVKGI